MEPLLALLWDADFFAGTAGGASAPPASRAYVLISHAAPLPLRVPTPGARTGLLGQGGIYRLRAAGEVR